MKEITTKIIINTKQNIEKISIYPEYLYNSDNHISYMNKLFMNIPFENDIIIKKEIKIKISSYRQQDINKKRLDKNNFVSYENVIEKLVASKLRCVYCKQSLFVLYKYIREQRQWTIDRINNDLGHNIDNIVISCLACNLKRRTTNMEKFKFTKQLKIIKL